MRARTRLTAVPVILVMVAVGCVSGPDRDRPIRPRTPEPTSRTPGALACVPGTEERSDGCYLTDAYDFPPRLQPTEEFRRSCQMRIQAPLPQGLSQDKDVQFAAPDGVELCMDIYRPDDGQTYPLVVAIHAGGMRCCTRAELGDESKQLALSGYVVINVDYRYYPYHFPTAWTDVVSAIDYMREHATEYRVDVDNIGLLGSSAGGTITGWGISHPVPGLKAGVSWSGAFDLRPFDQVAIDGRPGAVAHVLLFFGCYGCPEVTKFASVLAVSSDTLPLRLFNSENEIQPLLEATAMRDALEEAGVPHELTVFPGTRHASAYADDALGPTIEWLDQYLK